MLSGANPPTPQRLSWKPLGAAVLLLLFLGGVISYIGIQPLPPTSPGDVPNPPSPQPAQPRKEVLSPVVQINLPYIEPELPPGSHQELFRVRCVICHSPRLVLTQPRLSAEKWREVVHKMVVMYGAPVEPDEEAAIVAYLTQVRGAPPK